MEEKIIKHIKVSVINGEQISIQYEDAKGNVSSRNIIQKKFAILKNTAI